jgi:multicomponent Na+:H+ antiporter subunit D
MKILLILPIITPFFTAICCLFLWRYTRVQRILTTAGTLTLAVISLFLLILIDTRGIQSIQIGNWPAPFGITIVADLFSSIMVVMAGMIGLCVAFYSLGAMDQKRESFGYYPLFNILLMGVCGAFLTGDIFNLYVWFEVMLIASFVLLSLGGEEAQLEGTVKYVTLNLLSSTFFLTSVGIMYGLAGTLNMADLVSHMSQIKSTSLIRAMAFLFFLAFGIKAAVFPLFFWLPASYHTPPAPVSAVFAGLLTKVGVYATIRVFTLIFPKDPFIQTLFLVVAGFTMATGVLGAVAQYNFRRLLSFHIISQVGYMIMGLGLFTVSAVSGVIYFMVHNITAKTNLFLISGVTLQQTSTDDLKKLGGFYASAPLLSILFLISSMAMAGLPPLSGFWAKFVLIKAGLDLSEYIIISVALAVSLLTLYSMTKIWNEAFWKDPPETIEKAPHRVSKLSKQKKLFLFAPIVTLAMLSVIMGIIAEPFLELTNRAAEQLLNPAEYIHCVLGSSGETP